MPVHEYVNATMSTSKVTVGSKDARRGTVATFLARSPKDPCTYFLNAYVVPASCVYDIVAGGAPGTHGNLRNLLQRLNATTSLLTSRILSSAFSVVIPAGCEATLQVLDYQTTSEVTSFFGPGKFIITSPNYPWIFDEGKMAPANYSQLYLPITYKDTYSVDFWLDRIEGSYVSIFLEQYTQQGTVWNMFNATMNVLTNGNLTGSSGQGLAVGWYPKAGDGRKGFVCRGVAYDSRAAPTAWPVTAAALLLPVVNLTVENPSYAIHGLSLDWYKQVTINSSPGCTLIFDVTIRAGNGESIFSYDTETALYNCVENRLNDGIDNMTVCSWPYSKSSTVLRIGDTTTYEFGISIRVKEWTEASFDVVLMPVHAYVNDSIATSMITVGAENSTRGTVATFVARNPTVPCTIFLTSRVTPDTCIYDVVAGGIPSAQGNPPNLLQRVEATTGWLESRILSSAFSIVVPAGCAAIFQVVDWNATDYINGIMEPGKFVLTSPNYPWIFDEGRESDDEFQQVYLAIGYRNEMSVDFWFDRVEGGSVNLLLFEMSQQGTIWNELNVTYDETTVNQNLTGQVGQQFFINWIPKPGAMRKGFLCRGVAYDYREAPTAWPITESPTSPDEPSSSENPAPTPTSAPILTTSKTSANHFLQLSSLVLIYLLLA